MKAEYYNALGLTQWVHRKSGYSPLTEDNRTLAGLMIVAEGELVDSAAGQLLTAMLNAINLKRDDVLIVDIEMLDKQMLLTKPRLILAMGEVAAHALLQTTTSLSSLRNQTYYYGDDQIPLIVSYHPTHLLIHPEDKRHAWQDLQTLHSSMAKSL